MAQESKRYYWIKLKTDFFNQETVDFLLTQQNGCEYVVLYQMLCLQTVNTEGAMISKIGEIIVPYDIGKIVRDTKYFDYDTVAVALELFKKLGLIYEEKDKTLRITNLEDMVGSETSSAQRVREWRKNKLLQCNTNVTHNVTQEYRDKSIEYRDIYKKENIKEKKETISGQVSTKVKTNNITYYEKLLSTNKYEIITGNFRLEEAIKEWLRYKEERKEIYKEIGLQSLLTQIEKQATAYGEQQVIDLITECMANNYKGIIFDKLKNKPQRKHGVEPEWLGKEYKEEMNEETKRMLDYVNGKN